MCDSYLVQYDLYLEWNGSFLRQCDSYLVQHKLGLALCDFYLVQCDSYLVRYGFYLVPCDFYLVLLGPLYCYLFVLFDYCLVLCYFYLDIYLELCCPYQLVVMSVEIVTLTFSAP